jgi:MFS family permease
MEFNFLGFTLYDVSLVIACTFGAIVGSFAHAIAATIAPEGPPNVEGVKHFASSELQKARGAWMAMRMMLGGILGFVFGLYFVGTLHETPATFAKVWALSFLVGYAAPKLWVIKEEALLRVAKVDGREPE